MLTFEDAFSAKLNLLPWKMLLFTYPDLYFMALALWSWLRWNSHSHVSVIYTENTM